MINEERTEKGDKLTNSKISNILDIIQSCLHFNFFLIIKFLTKDVQTRIFNYLYIQFVKTVVTFHNTISHTLR